MVNREFRLKRLWAAIVGDLMRVLRLNRETTIVVTPPETLALDGAGRLFGRERRAGIAKLKVACREAGLERWDDAVWWWPITGELE